jgi:hypothetical protein
VAFFITTCDQSEIGRSLSAIGDSIHEIGCFCGYEEQNDAAVHKIGPFYGYEG